MENKLVVYLADKDNKVIKEKHIKDDIIVPAMLILINSASKVDGMENALNIGTKFLAKLENPATRVSLTNDKILADQPVAFWSKVIEYHKFVRDNVKFMSNTPTDSLDKLSDELTGF